MMIDGLLGFIVALVIAAMVMVFGAACAVRWERQSECIRAGYHDYLNEDGKYYCTTTARVSYHEATSTKRLK